MITTSIVNNVMSQLAKSSERTLLLGESDIKSESFFF